MHIFLVNDTAFSADSDRVSFLASRDAITLMKQCGDDATLLGAFDAETFRSHRLIYFPALLRPMTRRGVRGTSSLVSGAFRIDRGKRKAFGDPLSLSLFLFDFCRQTRIHADGTHIRALVRSFRGIVVDDDGFVIHSPMKTAGFTSETRSSASMRPAIFLAGPNEENSSWIVEHASIDKYSCLRRGMSRGNSNDNRMTTCSGERAFLSNRGSIQLRE